MTNRISAGLLVSALGLLAADPAVTIYNQNFAVVRETVPLDLKMGVNHIRYIGLTARAEPTPLAESVFRYWNRIIWPIRYR